MTTIDRTALLSGCSRYRYSLERRWGRGGKAVFILLNPSTADAHHDDPTVRRCMSFARAWGLDGIVVVNLYAYRATRPSDLWQADDPVGPDNDHHLAAHAAAAQQQDTPLVAGWGAHARADRIGQALTLPGMDRIAELATTRSGQPRHPLYLPRGLTPRPWTHRSEHNDTHEIGDIDT